MPLWPVIPAVYVALLAWLAWEIRRAPVIEETVDETPYHVSVFIDHDLLRFRVRFDNRNWAFYWRNGSEPAGVVIDADGPEIIWRTKMEVQ